MPKAMTAATVENKDKSRRWAYCCYFISRACGDEWVACQCSYACGSRMDVPAMSRAEIHKEVPSHQTQNNKSKATSKGLSNTEQQMGRTVEEAD